MPGCAHSSFEKNDVYEYDIAFLGSASPFNVEGIMKFDAKVMPIIKRMYPNVKVAVAGDVSTCKALNKLNPDIYDRLGRISQLSDFYRRSKLIISPIISGAGMKVKNIEAMSYGKAIVATAFSMDGINVVHEESALVSTDWKAFAGDVLRLLADTSLREKIEGGVRKVFKKQYSFEFKRNFYEALLRNNFEKLQQFERGLTTTPHSAVSPLKDNAVTTHRVRRTKALIFSMDAHELIDFNLYLAKALAECGIYSECVRMEDYGKSQFLDAGFLVHGLRSRLSSTRRKELKDQLKSAVDEEGNFTELSYKGVDIADDILIYRQMFPEHFMKNSTLNIIVHGFLILDALCEVADKVKPTFLVGWNGNGPHMVCLMKILSRVLNIPIFHVERGLLPGSLVFDAQGVNFKSVFAGSFLPPINAEQRKNARAYIEEFRKKSQSIVVKVDQKIVGREELFERFSVKSSGYVFFPMQIEGDSNIIINSPHYKTMKDVILDLSSATSSLGLTLICRPHPENKASVDMLEKLVEDLEHVYIDNSIDLHTMLKHSLATVAINSTVGLESLLHGVPTIALGHSMYSNKGITYDCFCEQHICNALTRIIGGSEGALLDHIAKDRLERLVHVLVGEYLIFMTTAEGVAPNNYKLEQMLLRGGVVPSKDLGVPGIPKAVQIYRKTRDQLISSLRQRQSVTVKNLLEPNTVQYLNGSKKIPVTDDLILKELKGRYNLDASICGKKNKIQADIVIINEGKCLKNSDSKAVAMNEFFEVLDVRVG
ncbi:glycosyltransferase [Pontiellaceae bacterium B1224]|nr:glycosyltransferase [Pontiellaceae bacterium B1224]